MARPTADPITVHACLTEIEARRIQMADAENLLRHTIESSIRDAKVPAATVAAHLGMSRATLFRWLKSDYA